MSAADSVALEGEEFSLSSAGEEDTQVWGKVAGDDRLRRDVADTGDCAADDGVLCPCRTGRSTLRCGVDILLLLLRLGFSAGTMTEASVHRCGKALQHREGLQTMRRQGVDAYYALETASRNNRRKSSRQQVVQRCGSLSSSVLPTEPTVSGAHVSTVNRSLPTTKDNEENRRRSVRGLSCSSARHRLRSGSQSVAAAVSHSTFRFANHCGGPSPLPLAARRPRLRVQHADTQLELTTQLTSASFSLCNCTPLSPPRVCSQHRSAQNGALFLPSPLAPPLLGMQPLPLPRAIR
jgi:hypothetical protein